MMTKRLRIHGLVQGVFYRNWSLEQASSLGLGGWVCNRRDGSVEILVSGSDDAVTELIERCREGPPHARVERIDIQDADETAPSPFEKRPSF